MTGRRWVLVAAVMLAAVAVATMLAVFGRSGADIDEGVTAPGSVSGTFAGGSDPTIPASIAGGTTAGSRADTTPVAVDPESLVHLEDVWLLDRGDGDYDWGLVVVGGEVNDRTGVEVTVRLVDAGGAVRYTTTDTIQRLATGRRAPVGGIASGLDGVPTRIEADVSVGVPAQRPLPGTIEVRGVQRRPDPRSGGGGVVLTGRLHSTFVDEVDGVRLAALWYADDEPADTPSRGDVADSSGPEVIASIFYDVSAVRPGIDAWFQIPLDESDIPDRPPDDVLWSR